LELRTHERPIQKAPYLDVSWTKRKNGILLSLTEELHLSVKRSLLKESEPGQSHHSYKKNNKSRAKKKEILFTRKKEGYEEVVERKKRSEPLVKPRRKEGGQVAKGSPSPEKKKYNHRGRWLHLYKKRAEEFSQERRAMSGREKVHVPRYQNRKGQTDAEFEEGNACFCRERGEELTYEVDVNSFKIVD